MANYLLTHNKYQNGSQVKTWIIIAEDENFFYTKDKLWQKSNIGNARAISQESYLKIEKFFQEKGAVFSGTDDYTHFIFIEKYLSQKDLKMLEGLING